MLLHFRPDKQSFRTPSERWRLGSLRRQWRLLLFLGQPDFRVCQAWMGRKHACVHTWRAGKEIFGRLLQLLIVQLTKEEWNKSLFVAENRWTVVFMKLFKTDRKIRHSAKVPLTKFDRTKFSIQKWNQNFWSRLVNCGKWIGNLCLMKP